MTNRKGFTLIELLIVVVIIGILAAIAIPKFANTKDKAKIASMKSDLRNLVSAQEGHFADFATYAAGHNPAAGCTPSAASICFAPTTGNTLTIGAATAGGFNATITNASLSATITCGVFVGTAAAPNAAVTQEGAPACW
ncbi:MAG TPA: prepilin-type N-terminal cleavage/methylation domain-containing protein [Gemmatimonadales bacterium]|nr:prepilin-type N-terminal cleavage/methylation domain-containing protein [Gemmatimonadales bacterium]